MELPRPHPSGWGPWCVELRVLHSHSGVPRSALWSQEGAGQGTPSQAHGGTPGSQPEGTERLGSLVRGLCGQPGCRARGAGPPAQAVPWESHTSPGLRFLSWPWGGGCAPRGCACLGLGRGLAAAVTPGRNARPRLGAGGRQRQDGTDGHCVCFPPRQPYFWAALVLGAVSGQSGWGLWQSGQLCRAEGPPGGRSLGWGGCLVPSVAHGTLGVASPPPHAPTPADLSCPASRHLAGRCLCSRGPPRGANIPGLPGEPTAHGHFQRQQ